MSTNPSEKLLSDIDVFLNETGVGPSYFGKAATGNSEMVKRLRSGGRVLLETEQRARDFMRQYRKDRASKAESAA